MAVSHLGHQLTTLKPFSRRFFSCAFLSVHQAASIYSSRSVIYGSFQLSQTPRFWNWSVISSRWERANSLHFATKFPTPYFSMSFLDLKPSTPSTFTSMGSPCISHPALSRTCLLYTSDAADDLL